MEQELPKPLVSDDQIIQEEEAWNGSIDGGLKEKLASTYTARWVRDIYESELQSLRSQVEAMLKDILSHIADYGYVHDKFKEQAAKHGITLP